MFLGQIETISVFKYSICLQNLRVYIFVYNHPFSPLYLLHILDFMIVAKQQPKLHPEFHPKYFTKYLDTFLHPISHLCILSNNPHFLHNLNLCKSVPPLSKFLLKFLHLFLDFYTTYFYHYSILYACIVCLVVKNFFVFLRPFTLFQIFSLFFYFYLFLHLFHLWMHFFATNFFAKTCSRAVFYKAACYSSQQTCFTQSTLPKYPTIPGFLKTQN